MTNVADARGPAPEAADFSSAALWFGLAAAPTAWAVLEAFGWWVGGVMCGRDGAPRLLGAAGLTGLYAAVALAMVLVAIAGLAVSWRIWRRTNGEDLASIGGRTRVGFMAAAGVVLGGIFLLAVVLTGLPIALTGVCAVTR